ncbi:MAG: gliding motility-associated C-terminal domain-containing protein [Ekhidna sp.]|nr:gliding motility-associated C-terminal domain-containing protein [Ekhidna sp.]
MNNYLQILLTIIFTFVTFLASAQTEICNNKIDDDGDGMVDCFDGDCSTNNDCDGFFFGNAVSCSDEIEVSTFAIRQQWTSDNETATSHATPVVGDLDLNGIPEVISVNNRGTLDLFVLNGATGETIAAADIGFVPENTPVIADVNNDDAGDIIVAQDKGNNLALYNVNIDNGTLTLVWRERASRNMGVGTPGVADFDEDGDVEIYYRNEIMNASDGSILIAGDPGGNWVRKYISQPIAADIFDSGDCPDCAGLELITGNEIWSINEAAGTRQIVADLDDVIHDDIDANLNYYPAYEPGVSSNNFSSASIADYNLDGNLDVILSGKIGENIANAETAVFFWDVANQNVITWDDGKNFKNGTGRINIGDVDGDGRLNASFVMDQKLISLDENFNFHWDFSIDEGSSGYSGCSLFDFEGDGSTEIVYRSEELLLILRGEAGLSDVDRVRKSIACRSRTQEEYPVIADVDGDGNSEICVACYFDNTLSFDPYNNTQFSSIRVYESNGEAWMPARRVWNQHGYYNVNINDDLTIPKEIQDHAVKFANPGTCQYADGTPIPFDSKPLNTFLNQAPILNEQGCVEFVSPDINFVSVIRADPVACPDATTEVEFQLTNSGEADISGNLPVSYYSGDPTTPNATLLDTEVTLLENFQVGETMNVTQNVTALGGEYQLYVVINDNGSTPPISVPPPTATIPECNTANNIGSTAVTFLTFTLQTEVLSSNEKCADSYFADTNSDGIDEEIIIPDNGAARAYYRGTIPGSTGTFWLENFEDSNAGDTDDTGATSWSSDPGTITPDFYGVAEEDGGKWFQARHTGDEDDEGVVTWTSETIDISGHTDISLFIDLYETGQLESSGRNRDFIRAEYILRNNSNTITASGTLDNGEHYGNFDYARASLTNINDAGQNNSSLTIIVSMHNSSSNESHYIDNIELQGTTTSTPAELTEGDGFEFYWYDAADTDYSDLLNNTSTFSQMDGGQYNVLGYFPATDCYSDTTTVTIPESTTTIYVWAYQEAPNTNCETPNGITAAFVYTSTQDGTFPATAANIPLDTLKTADGYTFTWFFEGDAATAIGTGDRLTNRNQTGYTVEVFQPSTGCTSSTNVDVTSTNTQITGVNKQIRNITECEGLGWLGANVGGSVSGFTFYWYDGTSIKPTPDFVGVLYYPLYDQGDFLLVVEDDISKCTSAPIPFRLEDESPAPTPTASLFTNNTSCVAGNGIVTADGDGSGTVAGYTFEWFLGDNTLASNALPGDAAPGAFLQNDNPYELGGLKEATYTVRVTEDATGCAETRTVRVNDAPTSLMINNTAINTDIIIGSCDPAELGVIDASGVVLDDITAISIGNINGNFEIPDISGYTFLPQEDLPGWSTTATDNEVELWNDGTFGVDAFEGEQFAEILANEIGALYFDLSTVPGSLFSWAFAHRGRANGRAPGRGPRDSLRVSIGNPSAVLRQGDFGTGTTAWEVYSGTYVVPDDQFVTRFQFESLDPGSVGNLIDSVSFVLLPYRFQLYEGTVASGDPDYMNVDGQFEDLDPGNYVLVVNDNLTGCAAVEIPITITREETAPVIPAPAITHDAHCKDDAGAIEISAASTPEPATYTYELFDGHSFATQIGPAQTAASGTSFTFDNIGPGDYRVRVTNDATLCTSFVDEIINDATVIPVFNTSYVLNHNTSCNPLNPNGQIIVSIDISGYNPNNYNFSWYEGSSVATGTPLPARSGVGANSLSDLSEGDFTVVAENISDGCETMELTIPLLDQPFVPDVLLTQDNPDTSCDVGNGQLSALVNNDPNSSGSAPFYNNYTFEWYYNGTGPITAGSDLGNNSNVSFSGTNNSTISGLSGDLNEYSVTVMHNDLECNTTERIILTEDLNVPTITAVPASNTTCIPAAATGTITVTNDIPTATDRYYYYRSDGTLVTDAAPVSGSSTDNVSGLTDDTYKVVAETNLGCTSDTLTVVVGLTEPTLGAGESGLTNNTVCDPAGNDPGSPDANGAVTFTPTGGTGTNLFSFALRRRRGIPVANDGTTPVHEDVRYNNAGVTTTTVTGIPRGNYIMEITDETSGCSIDHPFAIRDEPETLTLNTTAIDASINPNNSCNPANYTGTATVNVADITNGAGTALTDYSFSWAAAADPATEIDDDDVLDDDVSGNTGVEDGDYILIVTDRITGCVSAAANFTVPENSPSITSTTNVLQDNFSCNVAAPTGSATLTIAEGPNSNYSFAWYQGTSATGPVIDTDDQIDNQLHGTYTVRITDNATSCTETASVVIGEFAPTLSIGSSSSGDHSDCYPANGDVTVTPNLTFTPAGPPTGFAAAYTYQWYFGTSATLGNELLEGMDPGNLSTPTNVTTNNVTGLAAGDYTVVITETQTGCVSGIETVTVADEVSPYKPTITFTSNIIPSSCDALNGRITAEITGMPAGPSASGGGVGFSFEWYEGAQNFATLATTGSGTELETGDNLVAAPGTTVTVTNTGGTGLGAETTLDAIISGLYTLVTIDNTTGCRFSDIYELGFAGQQVTTTLTVENVEECPDNGTARVGLADNIILTVSAASGTFTVGEPFTTLGGASGTIASDRGLGEVQIALDGATVPVVGETITETSSGENATIDAVNNVDYATGLRHFDDISQYLIYLYAGTGVPADPFAPYTYAGRSFPYTYDPATGEILDGNGDALAGSPGPVLNAGQEAEFPELPAGDYVAIAREILNPAFNPGSTSQCWTAASLDEEILDLAYEPIIQSRTVTNNTNCDITNGNGAISLTVIENPAENRNPPANRQPNGYRFTWLRVIDGTIIRNVDTPAETAIFTQTDLNAGDYTVTIQRLGGPGGTPNNCETSVTITVGNNPEQHLITGATIGANDDCNPLDGSIVINDTDVTDNTNDYRFTWYTTYIADGDPGNVLLPDANVDGGLNGDINASSVSDLESGTYSVQAVHVTKTCITNVFEVEVDDNRLDPAFNVAQTARDIVCDDAAYTPTGQATLTITNGLPANPADYTISWFEDAAETQLLDGSGAVDAPLFSLNNSVADQLPEGTYYVRIEDNVTPGDGCISALQSVTIDQFNTTISVTNSDVTHNINCDPDNGRIQVNDISEDRPGIAPLTVSGGGIALTNYDFTWLEGDAATPVAVPSVTFLQSGGGAAANGGADASVAAGLPTGTYYLQIENNTTGCESELIEFSIEDNTAIPTFNVAQTARDIVCDDAAYTPTGQATLTITNGLPANPADYTISWFEDAAETQPLDGTPAGTVVSETLTANNTRIDGLPAGTYYVRIEDNVTPGDGCRSVRQSVTIDQFNTTISVTNSNVTHNTNCDPDNGRIQVNDISEDRPGGVTLSVSGGTVALTDYNFTWLEEDAATLVAVAAFPSVTFELSGGGAAANGGPDASVVDGLPTGTYYLQLENNTTGCESDLIEFFIDEEAEDPVINLESKNPDTFCAGNNRGDGTLAVNIFYDGAQIDNPTTNAAEYVVEWYRGTFRSRPAAGTGDASFLFDNQGNVGTVPNIGDAAQGADISVLSGLADGTYSVYVNKTGTEPYTGCNTIATFTIDPNDDYYFLAIDFIQSEVEADTICTGTPSGTITINDASITGNLNDFTIEVREGSVTGAHIGASPFTNNGSPEIRITGLTANEYFILGTHTGTGCRIPTGSVIIEDLQEAPIISLVSMEPDENCGTSAMVGELEVLVNGGEDHTNPRLSFQWVNDATGNNVSADFIGVTDTEATLTGVPGGDYSVTVTANLPTDTPPSTGCSATASYTILTEMPLPSIEDIDITPNNICDDDGDDTPAKTGSFQVLRVNYEGASAAPTAGEYTLTVFESNGTTQVAAPDDAANPVSNLDAGTYFASIERVSTSCASELLQFEIENNVLKPLIAIDLMTADPTCTAGFTSEGTLRATATLNDGSGPFDDTNTDYTFQWYDGAGTGTVLTGETSSTISNLDAGTYTVEVERVSTGCVTTQEFELPNVPVTVEILRADTVSSTNCNGNGSITVASVSRDNVTDYDFDYYDTDPTSGSPAPVFASTLGGAYNTAVPGTYWIIGTNTIVGCTTLPLQVVIGENFEYPTITLEEFDNPSNCDPDMPDGRLRVLANGEEEGTNYDFEWYFGDDTTNPLTSDDYTGGAELAGANTNEVTGVAAGTYTVEVTDLNTGCTITRTERLQDDNPNPIAISTSSSANTNCVSFNGSAAASVITFARGRRVNDYSFYWFTGDLAAVGTSPDTTAADFKGTLVQNLREGEYVVLAVDKTDLFCQSDATQVTVEDGTNRESIPYTLNINNVTVCFDQKNGGANLAFINPINATTTSIEWQDESGNKIGSSLTNSEFVIDSLEVGTYKMVLTDNNTLCTTNEIFDITDESMPPSAPTVQVINNRTNCAEANGSAVANVAGSTLNMFFEWFDPTNMNTPVFTGSSVSVLDSITYLVRATNLNTGCISPLTQVEILYQITDPVFSIEVESSLCLRTEDGVLNQFTGTAIVNFAEFNDASLSSYEWIFLETNEVVGMGTRLIDAIPGNYGVRFTADNGCEYYDEFELGIDLSIYNGVSANGDGKNDFFLIDCVDLFPNNNVKIFNRAGQKIYDVDTYNNTSTRFEGVSNVGAGGLVLPVGTYFYLIDLGTGGDLIQGYLELVR